MSPFLTTNATMRVTNPPESSGGPLKKSGKEKVSAPQNYQFVSCKHT